MITFRQLLTELKLTIQYHSKLNPKIWHQGKLSKQDSETLVKLAYEFVDFNKETRDNIKDIVFTGSCANFNYTKFSDIDVHILVENPKFTDTQIHDKKNEWEAKHPNLKMNGYPIELYIQDNNAHFPDGQGVFSLLKNEWVISPKHLDKVPILDDPNTKVKIEHYISKIKNLIKSGSLADIKAFKTKLHNKRQAGLTSIGEFSIENIVYKELRNRGLIDKLNSRYHSLKEGTIKESFKLVADNPNADRFIKDLHDATNKGPDTTRLTNRGVAIDASKFGGGVHISSLISSQDRNKGSGTEALVLLTQLADKHQIPLSLVPTPIQNEGGMKEQDLKKWYANYGFQQKGDRMIRQPIQRVRLRGFKQSY